MSRKSTIEHLYIHIPFCVTKCGYCDFAVHVIGKEPRSPASQAHIDDLQTQYLTALSNELEAYKHSEITQFSSLRTLYIGGGTPTALSAQNLSKLAKIIETNFPSFKATCEEITIEAESNTLSEAKLEVLEAEIGASRMSIGCQSMKPKSLKLMNRGHSVDDLYASLDLIASKSSKFADFQNINLDYLIGLPHESEADLVYSMDKIIDIGPGHVSPYVLELEKGTNFGKWFSEFSSPLPSEEALEELFVLGHEYMEANGGFERYQLSNFAKNRGLRSTHNLMYWTNLVDFLGVGCGAGGKVGGVRVLNSKNVAKYIKKWGSGDFRKIDLFGDSGDFEGVGGARWVEETVFGMILTKYGLIDSIFGENEFFENELIPLFENKIDPEFYQIVEIDAPGELRGFKKLQKGLKNETIVLTTRGLFRADAMTSAVSELIEDHAEVFEGS